jgi:translation initiation factor 3 subunit G
MRRRNDENSVRVTNLSEDTIVPGLLELFRPFGTIKQGGLALSALFTKGEGVGFVSFVHREDGEKAIGNLNGYGYDNLTLRVECAAPRSN